jgi:hypothetical protein
MQHLQYTSLEAWFKGEGLTGPIAQISDPAERDRRIAEYGELRQHLFAEHIKALTEEVQHQFAEGTHPSQSHRFAEQAQPFADSLREDLASLGFPANVSLGWYHLDRIVLSADLLTDPGERRSELPWLHHGFEVKYHWPSKETN